MSGLSAVGAMGGLSALVKVDGPDLGQTRGVAVKRLRAVDVEPAVAVVALHITVGRDVGVLTQRGAALRTGVVDLRLCRAGRLAVKAIASIIREMIKRYVGPRTGHRTNCNCSADRHERQSDERAKDAEEEWRRAEGIKRLAPEKDDHRHSDAKEDESKYAPNNPCTGLRRQRPAESLSHRRSVPVRFVSHICSPWPRRNIML